MDNVYFDSEGLYIASATGVNAKVAAIDRIIDALLDVAVKAATTGNISEYSLNDGQTIIRTLYAGPSSVYDAINNFRRLRQAFMDDVTPRMTRLVDSKVFFRRGGGRFGRR